MMVTDGLAACAVAELRRYRLRPGALGDLLAVFEGRLVEAQEQAGMTVAGLFRDERDPDAFVWMRGFRDHAGRVEALSAFYGGPVWARNAAAANATMIDSDDVRQVRPLRPAWPVPPAADRPDVGAPASPDRVVAEVIGLADGPAGDAVEDWFAGDAVARLQARLGAPVAAWRTDPTPNGFPRLPVRPGRVIVWHATFTDADARQRALQALAADPLDAELDARATSRARFRLTPTVRSAHPAPTRP